MTIKLEIGQTITFKAVPRIRRAGFTTQSGTLVEIGTWGPEYGKNAGTPKIVVRCMDVTWFSSKPTQPMDYAISVKDIIEVK